MSDTVAFALTADYEGTVEVFDTVEDKENGTGRVVDVFQGGIIAIPGRDEDFDVKEHLTAGDGVIVVSAGDAPLVLALDEYVALKRVPAPDAAEPVSAYGSQRATDLRTLARTRGIDIPSGSTKDDIVALLEAQDAAVAAGDQGAADNPDPQEA